MFYEKKTRKRLTVHLYMRVIKFSYIKVLVSHMVEIYFFFHCQNIDKIINIIDFGLLSAKDKQNDTGLFNNFTFLTLFLNVSYT